MKRRVKFGRRLLTMILCAAMVFTNVNAPMNIITVEAALLGVLLEADGSNIKVTLPSNYGMYNIYVDGTLVKENVGPAVYTLEQAVAGEHSVKVVGIRDGVEDTADGVFEDVVTVAEASSNQPGAPSQPVGLVVNEVEGRPGVVCFAWAADPTVDHYIAKLNGVVVSENMSNGGTVEDVVNGTYEAALIAVNASGVESVPAVATLTVVNGVAGEDSEDEDTTSEYINLEAKSRMENGVWTFVATDLSDATFTYDGASMTTTASGWGNPDWWSVQWTVQDIDVTAGEWLVEYDIVSTINKPVMSKLTNFGVGDQDTPIIESRYDLVANEAKHYSEVATIGADGKVRLFFNLAGGTGAGNVTISNVKLSTYVGEEQPGGDSGNEGSEQGQAPSQPVGLVANEVEGRPGVVCLAWAADPNVDHYIAKLNGIVVSENMSNGGTVENIANGTYEVTLIAVNASGAESVPAVATLTVVNSVAGEDSEDEDTTSEYINLEKKLQEQDGILTWTASDATNATFAYDATEMTVTASTWGQQDWWSIQWAVQDIDVPAGEWLVEYDIISTINKPVMSKLTNFGVGDQDTPIVESCYDLVANEAKHYSEVATIGADGKVRLFFNLAGGTGTGTVTISNVKLSVYEGGELPGTGGEEPGTGGENPGVGNEGGTEGTVEYINLETKLQAQDGILTWTASDATNATFAYDATEMTVTASTWGQQDWWSIQWAVQDINVTAGEWRVEYDIVSTINKPVLSKLTNFAAADVDTPIIEANYNLNANEARHYSEVATIGADGKVRLFFNLAGGTGAGTVTISNIRIYPATEGDSAGSTKTAPAISTDKLSKANGYRVSGTNPVLNFADDADWRSAITTVRVNNKTVADDKYSVTEGMLTLDNSIFTKQGVYTILVEAEGYTATSMTLPVYAADLAEENWTVKWEDQFNGTTLDTAKWSYEIGVRSGDDETSDAPIYWGNNEKQYYTKEAVEVKDGYLVITGDVLTDDVKRQYNITDSTVSYTSGRIRTVTDEGKILAATTYGRIEAKMSLPAGDGYWPAFWMLPTQEGVDAYGTWAASGELDIMEAVGQNPGQVNGTIHYGGQWPNNVYSGGTHKFTDGTSIATEHLYAVEWEPGEIRWYVDDILYHVENNWYGMDATGEKFTYPAPYNEDFYLLFNLAMSGNYVSNVMPTDMGKQLKVDYVRILMDENTDYEDENIVAPSSDRDSEFFEISGGYEDLIADKDFTTLASHAYGDGATVVPGTGYWSSAVNTGAGAAATVSVIDGAAKVDVTKVGANDYNIQLIQNIPLAKGYTYRITFDAWTDLAGRSIVVAPKGDADNSWAAYDAGISAALTTVRKTFTYDFIMKASSDPTARLEMNLGGSTGSVYVDNVSVMALTDEQLENDEESGAKEPLSNGEHVYNGTFDKGAGRLGDWIVEGTKGSTENRDYTVTVGEEGAKLIQEGVQLLEQDDYRVSFEAKLSNIRLFRSLLANNEANVRVSLTDKAGEVVYGTKDYVLTSEMQQYSLNVTVPGGKGTDFGKLTIEFLGEGNTISIDNISMERLTNAHMEWDAYEFYPIAKGDLTGYTTYDEVWTWATNGIGATSMEGEDVFAIRTAPASQNWQVMFQRENVSISKGMTYHVQYAIKASAQDQPVEVKVEDTTYSPCYDANLTVGTEWKYVNTTFTSSLAGAGALKFCLAGVDRECTVYVKDISITLDGIPTPQFAEGKEVSKVTVGETVQLDIEHSVKVQNKYDVYTYVSSDENVVTVSEDGTLTAKAIGTAEVAVTGVLGTSFSFEITVEKAQNTGGTTSDGTTPDGTTPGGATSGGTTPGGTTQGGTTSGGTTSGGTTSGGTISGGTTSDEPSLDKDSVGNSDITESKENTKTTSAVTTPKNNTVEKAEEAEQKEPVVEEKTEGSEETEETVPAEAEQEEKVIEDDNIPLVSDSKNVSEGISPAVIIVIAAVAGLGLVLFFLKRKMNKMM